MLGPWTSVDLGFAYSSNPCLIWGGYLYQFGGHGTSGAQVATDCTVKSAKILPDGSLAPAKNVGSMPQARTNSILWQLGDTVFLAGGGIGGISSNLLTRYKMMDGGQISEPTAMPAMPVAVAASANGRLQSGDMVLLYNNVTGVTTSQFWSMKLTKDGPQQGPKYYCEKPPGLSTLGSGTPFIVGQTLYYAGGASTGPNTNHSMVWACRLGSLVWRRAFELPHPGFSFGFHVIDDNLLVICGVDNTISAAARWPKSYMVKLNSDGDPIGLFKEISTPVNPTAYLNLSGIVSSKTHIYAVGGSLASSVRSNLVQIAPILRGP